jgi:hypothetical protein
MRARWKRSLLMFGISRIAAKVEGGPERLR